MKVLLFTLVRPSNPGEYGVKHGPKQATPKRKEPITLTLFLRNDGGRWNWERRGLSRENNYLPSPRTAVRGGRIRLQRAELANGCGLEGGCGSQSVQSRHLELSVGQAAMWGDERPVRTHLMCPCVQGCGVIPAQPGTLVQSASEAHPHGPPSGPVWSHVPVGGGGTGLLRQPERLLPLAPRTASTTRRDLSATDARRASSGTPPRPQPRPAGPARARISTPPAGQTRLGRGRGCRQGSGPGASSGQGVRRPGFGGSPGR